jgi:hypothetical protein
VKPEWFMYLGFVLGAATAILFVIGQPGAGVIVAILTGLAWSLYGVTHRKTEV